ncbi:hypothetical protein E0Z10_g10045 [Xylaria hypoxylon]|uniref:DUF7730 domain-containing protein n=1 Tax=Xylaria hypoxylon TaxID=37992 RepID=A0A4Z0YM01_9PEZI|nr:hypothetical protein E0Z10_g10045 [Xylaria hypoxylon]
MNAFSACNDGPLASPSLEIKPLIPYVSDIKQLRKAYIRNQSSFLHRLPPEIRNAIMEYSVTLEEPVEPLAVTDNDDFVNKFVWGEWEYRVGIINGRENTFRFPFGPLAVISLCLTCRQLYHELNGVFYKVNTFLFCDATRCKQYLSTLTIERRHQIREICFDFTHTMSPSGTSTFINGRKLFTSKLGRVSKTLLMDCPLLKRLTIAVGSRPPRRSLRCGANPFTFEHDDLLWKQGDRNPARVFEQMGSFVTDIERALNGADIKDSPLSLPQLEFLIRGSPTISARVNGGTTHKSSPDAPNYVREFEDKVEMANKAMQQLYSRWLEPQTAKYYHNKRNRSLSFGESTRMQQDPRPDLANFQPFGHNLMRNPLIAFQTPLTVLQVTPKYDEKGLLVWKYNKRAHFIDILWRGDEIVCGVIIQAPNFKLTYSFENISRFANWKGVQNLYKYFNNYLNHPYYQHTIKHKLLILTESPSPKDIDAALRATGLLNYKKAPKLILQSWQTLLNDQDRRIAELEQTLEDLKQL